MRFELLIPIVAIASVVLIINQIGRVMRARMHHRTLREAIARDSNVAPEFIAKLDEDPDGRGGDARTGLILIAVAAALFGFGLVQGDEEAIRNLGGVALFPAFVGAALLGRQAYLARREGI